MPRNWNVSVFGYIWLVVRLLWKKWIQKSVLPASFALVMEHVFVDRYVNWIRFRDGHRKVLFHRHRIWLLDNVRHLCDINVDYRLNRSIYTHQSIKVRVI